MRADRHRPHPNHGDRGGFRWLLHPGWCRADLARALPAYRVGAVGLPAAAVPRGAHGVRGLAPLLHRLRAHGGAAALPGGARLAGCGAGAVPPGAPSRGTLAAAAAGPRGEPAVFPALLGVPLGGSRDALPLQLPLVRHTGQAPGLRAQVSVRPQQALHTPSPSMAQLSVLSLSVECDGVWSSYVVLGVVMLAVYVLGAPCFMFGLLWRRRDTLHNDARTKARYGFVFSGKCAMATPPWRDSWRLKPAWFSRLQHRKLVVRVRGACLQGRLVSTPSHPPRFTHPNGIPFARCCLGPWSSGCCRAQQGSLPLPCWFSSCTSRCCWA